MSRMRENLMSGSIGGRWRSGCPGGGRWSRAGVLRNATVMAWSGPQPSTATDQPAAYLTNLHGRTVDLTYQDHRRWSAADTTATAIEAWRATWCYTWLQKHAHAYGFAQNPGLNEPWHWEHEAG